MSDPTRPIPRPTGFFIVSLNIVDCLTLSGVLLSCLSIGLMLQGKLEFALGVLYIAVIADAFDGVLARKLGVTRDFGRYLDGFVDTLDYLVAPALFLYLIGFDATYQGLILIAFIGCGFIRLSIFNEVGNLEDEQSGLGYLGAPVFWSALLLGPLYAAGIWIGLDVVFYLLTILIPLFSIMMLHNGRYYKFKNPKFMLFSLLGMALAFFIWGGLLAGSAGLGTHILTALLASVPVIVGGALHMVVVKYDWLSFLKIPVNRRLFGANKTLRGFIVMPLLTMPGFAVVTALPADLLAGLTIDFLHYSIWLSGILIGLAYVIAELPNSFVKRRMGVPPGEVPSQNARLFVLADQLDSGILCIVAYAVFWGMPLLTCLLALVMTPLIALSVKRLLYTVKVKESAT